ncbi:MAG: carbohydrate kinase family protein, partial [Halobacteriaceae archaeon]
MNSQPTVVGVGNALLDETYELTNLPDPDGGAYVLNCVDRLGGVETNVCVLIHSLGTTSGIIARVGADSKGSNVLSRLDELDIDARRVRQIDGDITSYCLVLTEPNGERMIIGGGDSTLNLELNDADLKYIEAAKV